MTNAIRLQDAFLCPDCQLVIGSSMSCLCGNSQGLLSLSAVLNRTPAPASESLGRMTQAVVLLETALAART